jgi:hypothetical protein
LRWFIRGGCQFDDKVRNAQDAGFKAAVVYDNEDNGALVSSNDPDIIFYHSFSYMLSFISATMSETNDMRIAIDKVNSRKLNSPVVRRPMVGAKVVTGDLVDFCW